MNNKLIFIFFFIFLFSACNETYTADDIFKAVDSGNANKVTQILDTFPESIFLQFDPKDGYQYDTPLLYAVDRERTNSDVITILLKESIKKSLDIVIYDSFRILLRKMNFDICNIFIDNGFDVNKHPDVRPPLSHYMSDYPENYDEIIDYLLTQKLNFNVIYKRKPALSSLIEYFNRGQAKYLIRSGIDVNIKDNYGETPLFKAARKNQEDIVKLLLEYGADPKVVSNFKETPVMFAETKKTIELFIEKGVNINARNKSGLGLLNNLLGQLIKEDDENIINSFYDAIKYALENGLEVNYRNAEGHTPLYDAIKYKLPEKVIELLKKYGAKMYL